MRAIVQDEYGDTEVLRLEEIDEPTPKPGTVLIRVKAAGVNMADWHLMTGLPKVARLALGFSRPKGRVRGEDVAGIVEAVGDGVTEFAIGDEVLGAASGSFADFALAHPKTLARKPAALSWSDAGALPMAASTALNAVHKIGVTAGDRVLVSGAAGGVGSFVVQLAAAAGAEVIAVCSGRKADFVRSLGATEVIDYTTTDISEAGEVDVVIDFAGNRQLKLWRGILSPTGRVLFGGAENAGDMFGGLGGQFTAGLALLGSKQSVGSLIALTRIADLRAATHPGKLVVEVS